jgi:iron complex outermembrane receptor protein
MKRSADGNFLRATRAAALAGVACMAGFGGLAQAQESKDAAVELQKVEVTGSRLQRVDLEGPAPVTIITREEIARQGYITVTDILGDLSQNSGGEFNAGVSFFFARGSQSVDLRAFGAGRTLVLLDGRRLPVFPQGLNGTDQFVDLSSIPVALVERVEILTDGASAIYGSDAIGGVVNIITRKNIEQTTIAGRISGTSDGGGSARRLQFSTGSFDKDSSYALTAEYNRQNALQFADRDYSDSDYNFGGNGSGFGNTFVNDDGSTVVDPDCGTADSPIGTDGRLVGSRCRFDRSKYRQWIPDSEKASVYLRGERNFDFGKFYTRLGYYQATQIFNLEPNAYSGGESFAFTSNQIVPLTNFPIDPSFGGNSPGYVPSDAPNDPTPGDGMGGYFNRRLVEFGPRGGNLRTEALTGLIGLQGNWGLYNWDVGVSRNQSRVLQRTPTIISSVFDSMVSNEGLDLLQPIPEANIIRASHTQLERGVSSNILVDGTVTGPLGLTLPGGPALFAVHTDYNQEEYEDTFDNVSLNGDVFDGGTSGGGDRDYAALGLELNLPVLASLEVNLAGRYDKYIDDSETGSAFSPRISIGYRPISSLLLRASAGKSFRAPDLQRLFGGSTNGFFSVIDTPLCLAVGGDPSAENPIPECQPIQSVPGVVGANPSLEEEKGENFNLGVSWEILTGLNATVDAYHIKLKNIVDELDAQDILDKCALEGNFCGLITREPANNPVGGVLGDPNTGGSSFALISATAQNLAVQQVEGVDVSLDYAFKLSGIGNFTTGVNWSVITSLLTQTSEADPEVQEIGFSQIPKHRGNLSLDWTLSNLGVNVRGDWIGRFPGEIIVEPAKDEEYIGSWITWNTQVRYSFGKWGTARMGVDNIFDKQPSRDPTYAGGGPNVQNQWLSNLVLFSNPLGRQGYLQYEFNF